MSSIPVRVGNYHVLGMLAEGGMGIVFQAVHMPLNRHCALKLLRSSAPRSRDARARFRIEAEAAARLRHPNIVELREAGEVDGESFIEMELVEGVSLAERLAAGQVDIKTCIRWMIGVARGLHHAHEFGVLHRDVKPGNILIDESKDVARLTDFGLARLADEESDLTASISVLGTPAYIAPEVAQAGGRAASVRSDVYGLGAVLYEVLSGHPPFRGDSAVATLAAVQRDAPAPLASIRPDLPPDLIVICERAMHREPGYRFVSAGELADELDRWLCGEPIRSRPVPLLRRLSWWMRRHPALAALSTALVFVVACGYGLTEWQRRVADTLSRDLLRQLSHAELGRAANWIEAGAAHQGLASLASTARRDPENLSVGIQLALQMSQPVWPRPRLALGDGAGPFQQVVSTVTDEYLLTASEDGWVQRWNLRDGQPRGQSLFHGDGEWASLLTDLNSDWILSLKADGRLRVWSALDETLALALGPGEADESPVHEALFIPKIPMVLVASEGRPVRRIHLESGGSQDIPGTLGARILALDGDGVSLACSSGDENVFLAHYHSLEPLGQVRVDGPVTRLVFGGKEKYLAVGTASDSVVVFDVKTQQEVLRRPNRGAMALAQRGEVLIHEPALGNLVLTSIRENSRAAGRSRGNMPHWGIRLSKNRDYALNFPVPGFLESVIVTERGITGSYSLPVPVDPAIPAATYLGSPMEIAVARPTSGAVVWRLNQHHLARAQFSLGGAISSLGFTASEDRLRILRRNGRLHEVSLTTLLSSAIQIPGVTEVVAAAFSPDARFLVVGTPEDAILFEVLSERLVEDADQQFSLAANTVQRTTNLRFLSRIQPAEPVYSFTFSPDGKTLAVSGRNRLQLWNVQAGREIGGGILLDLETFQSGSKEGSDTHYGLTRRRPGRNAVVNPNPTLFLPEDADEETGIPAPGRDIPFIEFSPNGRSLLLVSPGGQLVLMDAVRGVRLATPALDFLEATIPAARWMPDGQRLIVARSEGDLWVLDPRANKTKDWVRMDHPSSILSVDVHPKGRFVATLAQDRMVRVWNVETAAHISSQQLNPFFNVARFHPGGNAIQCLAIRGLFKLVDPWTGQVQVTPRRVEYLGSRQAIGTLVTGPLGGWAVVMNDAGQGVLLNTALPASAVPSWVPELAEAIAGRRLSPTGNMERVPPETYLGLLADLESLEGEDYWHGFFLKTLLHPPPRRDIEPPLGGR